MRASGETEMLENGGPPLGIVAMAPYVEQRVQLAPGDLLVVYSDGVTEGSTPITMNSAKSGLLRFCANSRKTGRGDRGRGNQRVAEFAAGAPPADDITLVVAKRL